jgi:hypothetical protein
MGGQTSDVRTQAVRDTETLYELGLAQAIDQSVCKWLRSSISIRIIAFLSKCVTLCVPNTFEAVLETDWMTACGPDFQFYL